MPSGMHRDPSSPHLGPADPLPGWPTADALEWAAQRVDHNAQPGGWAAQPQDWGLPALSAEPTKSPEPTRPLEPIKSPELIASPGVPERRWVAAIRRPWLRLITTLHRP